MSEWRLTDRGWRVVGFAATFAFLVLLGFAGWIEGLA